MGLFTEVIFDRQLIPPDTPVQGWQTKDIVEPLLQTLLITPNKIQYITDSGVTELEYTGIANIYISNGHRNTCEHFTFLELEFTFVDGVVTNIVTPDIGFGSYLFCECFGRLG